eukprot:TRINITY_DN24050_c0_g1_i1.p1 TRINITY_DN24050_c0_g1~~TRINITY_DN24050_c0_g1_i1.p1  ORF type:complete len:476 (+),score=150.36 TRINITY_DN24050_c0_g1_i1:78-1505(+)
MQAAEVAPAAGPPPPAQADPDFEFGGVVLTEQARTALTGIIEAYGADLALRQLACAICTTPAFACPVLTPCEHLFHEHCIERIGPNQQCPMCRAQFPPGPVPYVEAPRPFREHLNAVSVACPQECQAVMPFCELRSHLIDACPATCIPCANAGCPEAPPRSAVAEHARACSYAVVSCEHCSRKRKRSEQQAHVRECERRRVPCPHGCGRQGIVYCEMDAHRRDCPVVSAFAHQIDDLKGQLGQAREELERLRREQPQCFSFRLRGLDGAVRDPSKPLRLTLAGGAFLLRLSVRRGVLGGAFGGSTLRVTLLQTKLRHGLCSARVTLGAATAEQLAADAQTPRLLLVESAEHPSAEGTYALSARSFNGFPSWARADRWGVESARIYRGPAGEWSVCTGPDAKYAAAQHSAPPLQLAAGAAPVAVSGWYSDGKPAPLTKVCAALLHDACLGPAQPPPAVADLSVTLTPAPAQQCAPQ